MFRSAAQRDIHALRQTIERIEGSSAGMRAGASGRGGNGFSPLPRGRAELGVAVFDEALGGGFPMAGLCEIRTGQTRDWGAGCGFALALLSVLRAGEGAGGPLVWIAEGNARREGGNPWMPGIATLFGAVPPVLFVRTETLADTLWATETAAVSGEAGAVLVEIRGNPAGLGLSESRRLHLRARDAGRPLVLMRQAGEEEASAAFARFRVAPAPAAPRRLADGAVLAGSLGRPAFAVTLEKSRLPLSPSLILEWNSDEGRFDVRPHFERAGSAGPAHPGAGLPASFDGPDHAHPAGAVVAFARAS